MINTQDKTVREETLRECYYARTTIQEASERTEFSQRHIAKEWEIADFYGARSNEK